MGTVPDSTLWQTRGTFGTGPLGPGDPSGRALATTVPTNVRCSVLLRLSILIKDEALKEAIDPEIAKRVSI